MDYANKSKHHYHLHKLRLLVLDNNFLIPKLNFSPESGGKVKPRTAIDAISRQGTIKLEK